MMNLSEAKAAGWIEITSPELFKFDSKGDSLEGVLLDLRMETVDKKPVVTARFELRDGSQVKIRPAYDLREKLGRRLIGKRLHITYTGDNESTVDKGNAMKMFTLLVAPDATSEAPYVASDDDVPDFD